MQPPLLPRSPLTRPVSRPPFQGATVDVETTTNTTPEGSAAGRFSWPKSYNLPRLFGILALFCLGTAFAHSSYSATSALLSSQRYDSPWPTSPPATVAKPFTPASLNGFCILENPIEEREKAAAHFTTEASFTTATIHSKIEAGQTDITEGGPALNAVPSDPTTSKLSGAYAELAPFDETCGATKIGSRLVESFTTATALSEVDVASLLFLRSCAAVLALLLAAFLEPLLRGQVKKKRVEGRSHAAISVPLLASTRALRVGIAILFFLQGVCGTPAAPPSAPPISPPPSPPSPPKVLVQFAVTSGSRCAESLPYGPEPSNFATSTSPLVCTDCVTDTTDTWEQEFYCDGSTGPDLTLEYKFDTDRTIGATLAAANLGGIPVTWSASGSLLSSPVTMSGTWVGTSTTVYWTGSVGASGSALASDDFAWMGGSGVIIDGDQQNTVSGSTGVCSGTGVYGQSNCNSADSSCSTLYYGSSSKSCSSMITRVYARAGPKPPAAPPSASPPPPPPSASPSPPPPPSASPSPPPPSPPSPPAVCKPFCEDKTQAWDAKCTWGGCNGCTEC